MSPTAHDRPISLCSARTLVETETAAQVMRQQNVSATIRARAMVLNQVNVGNLNEKLRDRIRKRSKHAIRLDQELGNRLLEVGGPPQAVRHLMAASVSGMSHGCKPLARSMAKQEFLLRANRANTNQWLASRVPNRFGFWPPEHPAHGSLAAAPQGAPMPSDAEKEALRSADRAAILAHRKDLITAGVDPSLQPQKKVTLLVKKKVALRKAERLFRRYRHHINERCNRCEAGVTETVPHMFRDCPASGPTLAQLRDEIVQTENSHRFAQRLDPVTWRDLWTDPDTAYPGDNITSWWLLLGFVPKKAKADLGSALAKRKARQVISSDKLAADKLAHTRARLAAAGAAL